MTVGRIHIALGLLFSLGFPAAGFATGESSKEPFVPVEAIGVLVNGETGMVRVVNNSSCTFNGVYIAADVFLESRSKFKRERPGGGRHSKSTSHFQSEHVSRHEAMVFSSKKSLLASGFRAKSVEITSAYVFAGVQPLEIVPDSLPYSFEDSWSFTGFGRSEKLREMIADWRVLAGEWGFGGNLATLLVEKCADV